MTFNSTYFKLISLLSLVLLMLFPSKATSQEFSVYVESGGVFFSNYDVRIPNEGGTKFDLLDLIGTDLNPYFRIGADVTFAERHRVGLLFAPLSVTNTGILPEDVFFEDRTFFAGIPTEGTYQFSNYRLSYQYLFFRDDRWDLGAGFTAFIRDARVELSQNGDSARNTDLGFVPLINFYANYNINDRFSVALDGETLFGPQGRATDAALTLRYTLNDNFSFQTGYRILEGGADVDQVYNFAWLNFVLVGARYNF